MKKKLVTLLLALACLLGLTGLTACDEDSGTQSSSSPADTSSTVEDSSPEDSSSLEEEPPFPDTPTEGLAYELSSDGTYYIVSGIGTATDTDIVIPSTHEEKPVCEIGYRAFYYCTNLTSIVIPDSVQEIEGYAFSDCTNLTSVVIGDGVQEIGGRAFSSCDNLTSIDIPNSVQTIGDWAFAYCTNLTSVIISDSVQTIDNYVFRDCDNLTSITVSETNEYYTSVDGNLYNKDKTTLIQYAIGKTQTSFTIPDSVQTIGGSAFASCTNLTSVIIPDSVQEIGGSAFSSCDNLMSVTIPDSVQTIGSYAFASCTNLTSVVIGDSVQEIGIGAFYICGNLTSVYYNGTESEWNAISMESSNSYLTDVTRYYYSENEPVGEGNYWRYVDGVPTVW